MECECEHEGYCERLGRVMHGRMFQLCKTRSDYRAIFANMPREVAPDYIPKSPEDRVKDFLSSTATFLHNGAQVTTKELHDQRLAICRTCEEMKPGKVLGVALPRLDSCNVCGCFVTLKAAYPHEKCPVGLWDSVSTGKGCGGCGG